jgi:hypothetical protein
MAIIGAGTAMGLLILYTLVRSGTAGERRWCDLRAAAYDKGTECFDKQLESGEVEVVQFEADMVWDIARYGPPTYLFRVEPTKFALVQLMDPEDIWNGADASTVASRLKLECYPHIVQVASPIASGPHLAVQKKPMDLQSLIGVTDLGPLPYRIVTVDEVPSAQVRQELLEGAT